LPDLQPLATTLLRQLGGILLFCLLLPAISSAATLSGRVIDIPDANRLILLTEDGQRLQVALVGLALPDPTSRKWRNIAKRHLHMLLAGRFVTVEIGSGNRRGVVLGEVRHGGADVGLSMLRSGLAMIHRQTPPPSKLEATYLQAEQEARHRGMGYWQNAP
jgi:endonuclease YncB( thermonuclease family)